MKTNLLKQRFLGCFVYGFNLPCFIHHFFNLINHMFQARKMHQKDACQVAKFTNRCIILLTALRISSKKNVGGFLSFAVA